VENKSGLSSNNIEQLVVHYVQILEITMEGLSLSIKTSFEKKNK
jgi:hypothetical protein